MLTSLDGITLAVAGGRILIVTPIGGIGITAFQYHQPLLHQATASRPTADCAPGVDRPIQSRMPQPSPHTQFAQTRRVAKIGRMDGVAASTQVHHGSGTAR